MNWRKKLRVKARRLSNELELFATKLANYLRLILLWTIPIVSIVAAGIAVYDTGFNSFYTIQIQMWQVFHILIVILSVLLAIRFFLELGAGKKKRILLFHFSLAALFAFMAMSKSIYIISIISHEHNFLWAKGLQYGTVLILAFTEVSKILGAVYHKGVSSASLFVLSYLFIILGGTSLLLLPRSTVDGIGIIDALFTATSATCVTGLLTVSMADFTFLGQIIIITLIQLGGLGVMTFAGLLGHALAGQATFQSQLALKDMVSSNQLSNVIQMVYTIIGVSLLFEIVGIFAIYTTVDSSVFETRFDQMYFSVFHGISAFCNAGFSSIPEGLSHPALQLQYNLQWIFMFLIVFGGLGFPILFNVYRFFVLHITNLGRKYLYGKPRLIKPHLLNLTSRLALTTTIILFVSGTLIFALLEYNRAFAHHPHWFGKITSALFASVNARSAGFNTIDFNHFSMPSLMVMLLLMYVGASPGSTGGGIKTTTAAVAVLNMASIIRGKDRTEFHRNEISGRTIRRSFAVIALSMLVIGLSTMLLAINDADKGFFKIAFESFVAFTTMGVSLGITTELSATSKLVLSATMFLGRIGSITLLASFIRQSAPLRYRYPTEDILM